MFFSSKNLAKLIAKSLVIFFVLLLVDFSVYYFLVSVIIYGIPYAKVDNSIPFGTLNLFKFQSWIFIGLSITLTFVFIWIVFKLIQNIQIKMIAERLQIMREDGFTESIEPRFADTDTAKLVQQINFINASKQEIIDAERANENLQRELIGNISHDLRTPLTSILGYLGFMTDNKLNSDQFTDYSKKSLTQANNMKKMLEDLFDYTQTIDSQNSLNIQALNLSDFLEQLVVQFELQANEAGIVMDSYTKPNKITLNADPDKMARVFMNLINNAFKYAKGASFIKLNAVQTSSNSVDIYVQNDGESIPTAEQKKLFDRFYRVDKSRNKSISGNGLGLAISKGVVSQHHGQIRVESSKQITSFIISLPLDGGVAK